MIETREPIRLRVRAAQSARWPVLRRFHDRLEATFCRAQRGAGQVHAQTRTIGFDLLRGMPEPTRRHDSGEIPEEFMGQALHQRTSPKLSHGVKERDQNNQLIFTGRQIQKNEPLPLRAAQADER